MTTTETPMRERIARALATQIDCETEWDTLTLAQENWIFELADAVLDAMRGEVERLTLERDYWARARNEWEKSARLLEEENKRLTRELAYMTVQRDQWRSTCASHASRAEAAKKGTRHGDKRASILRKC